MGGDLRKLVDSEHGRVSEDHCAEHCVLELADIARPGVALEHRARLGIDAVDRLALFSRESRDEMADELRQGLEPLAQRPHPDRKEVEPAIEVLPEANLARPAR